MDDLELSILAAWKSLRPRLLADPHELSKRLARRITPSLQKIPRPWCLALRASDNRFPAWSITNHESPDSAQSFSPPDHSTTPPNNSTVFINAHILRKLCQPVHLTPPGETLDEVARKLGTTPMRLRPARIARVLRAHYVPGLAARRGRPVPLLYTDQPLDPTARTFASPDPVWTWTATFLTSRLPHNFEQRLTRIPLYYDRNSAFDRPDDRPDDLPPRKKYNKRLEPPPPDYVGYKWKDGVYLGYDWRNPTAAAGHARRQHQKELRHARYRENRASNPPPSKSRGSLHFRGQLWLCPQCHRTARTLYLPLPPQDPLINDPFIQRQLQILHDHSPLHLSLEPRGLPHPKRVSAETSATRWPDHSTTPPIHYSTTPTSPTFACSRCHNIRFLSRVNQNMWNEIIAFLSAGLLYGSEVPRPRWLTPDRKIEYTPHPNAKPSKRLPQVIDLLLKGLSYAQIAESLGLKERTINDYVTQIYKLHKVRSRLQLAKRLKRPIPTQWTSKKERVRQQLSLGLSYQQIATNLGLTHRSVQHHGAAIRREQKLPQDPRRACPNPPQRHMVPSPGTPAEG